MLSDIAVTNTRSVSVTSLTSEGAQVGHDPVTDVRHLDQAGVVGLGNEGTVGDTQTRHVDVDHVAADLHRGELNPEHAVAGVNNFVWDVSLFRACK